MTKPRLSLLRLPVALAFLALAACSDDPTSPEPQVIEQDVFDASLGIVLNDFTELPSGVWVQTVEEGAGDPVSAGQPVRVAYTGFLTTGVVFDSGQFPYTIGAGGLIPGFIEGINGMRLNENRIFIIPPALAYGNVQQGLIPPGSILIFEVVLLNGAG